MAWAPSGPCSPSLSAKGRRPGTPQHPNQDAARRAETAPGQSPFAVLFGCSDSRLAAEIIFDQGLGDLFVVRTAGHVAGPEVLGSIECGVSVLDCPLVVVLGHDSCGAIAAARAAQSDGIGTTGYVRDVNPAGRHHERHAEVGTTLSR
ncbi:carbonic anhydrase [Streptomyces virginiae]|uniref:carbonic anhydrase n=1 Tax=Streptomyces virginiae TaxID=1961 RepID=UPI0036E04327